ncbi:MAG: hypothetical protein GMKNLPBB_03235 [Myxococcota bacterium]|nr:hypothetical protein [Myxococcota bacterium]
MKLGEILVDAKLIDHDQLQEALYWQRKSGKRLASAIIDKGFINEQKMVEVLSKRMSLGGVVMRDRLLDLQMLHHIPRDLAKKTRSLPIRLQGMELHVAMAEPQNQEHIELLKLRTRKTIRPLLCLDSQIEQIIENAYDAFEKGERIYQVRESGIAHDAERSSAALQPGEGARPRTATEYIGDVLVVDDDPPITYVLIMFLQQHGFRVRQAATIREARAILQKFAFNLIFIDTRLTDGHGIELASAIRKDPVLSGLPVIMTASEQRRDGYQADLMEGAGVYRLFYKPFHMQEVLETVHAAVQGLKMAPGPTTSEEKNLFQELKEMQERGDLQDAILRLEEEVRRRPYSAWLYTALTVFQVRAGNDFAAIEAAESALAIEPRNFVLLFQLSQLYHKHGLRHRAVTTLARAALEAPSDEKRAELLATLAEWINSVPVNG